MRLLLLLSDQDGRQHAQEVLLLPIHPHSEVGAVEELVEEGLALVVAPLGQGVALSPLPAVAVGSGRGSLEAAVVATVAGVGTLRTAAQGACQPTGTTLKDVLGGNKKKGL